MEVAQMRKKYITYSLIIVSILFESLCNSIIAPFYPVKAAEKGVSPSQYGFVFGIFPLIVCLCAPIYGRFMTKIGPTFMFKAGVFVSGTCTLLFGFLDTSPPGDTFLGLSFAIRIVAALGDAAIFTSAYTIVPTIFPKSVATAVSLIESAFGLGALIGPAVGGVLHHLGGFLLPFEVFGAIMISASLITMFFLPNLHVDAKSTKGSHGVLQALAIPGVVLLLMSVVTCSLSYGFVTAVLEPHMREFHLDSSALGLVFMTGGIVYMITTTVWGRLMDKHGKYMPGVILAKLISSLSFVFLGPAPFIPLQKSLSLVIVGLACNGFGLAGTVIGSYVGTLDLLTAHKYPNDLETQGIVAGLFSFAFSLGGATLYGLVVIWTITSFVRSLISNRRIDRTYSSTSPENPEQAFIGPSIAGTLYDSIGFAYGSLVVLGILCTVAIALIVYALHRKKEKTNNVTLISVTALRIDITDIFTISDGKLETTNTTFL